MTTRWYIYRAPNLPDHPKKGHRCQVLLRSRPRPVHLSRPIRVQGRKGTPPRKLRSLCAPWNCAVRFEDGHIMMPRYLLVLDEDDQLVGIVSRRELVRGVLPQLREAERSRAQIRKLVGFGGETPAEISIRWTSLFTKTAVEAAHDPVSTVMAPVKGSVRVEDSLSTVITTMLHHGVDLVPVLDGRRVAGVVLMTNIFDIVAQFILEHGGRNR